MIDNEDTLNLSPTPNLADKVGFDPNGPASMSTSSAQQQIMQQAQMASSHTIPGQVKPRQQNMTAARRQLERQPMAQYADYQQPPVSHVHPSQMVQQQPVQPPPAPQYSPDYGAVGHMYPQQPMYQAPMYQQPVPQPMYQQPVQSSPMQMNDGFGAPFAELYATSNNEYECWIDLPGISTDSLNVMVRENTLHVSGERKLHSDGSGQSKKGKRSAKVVAVQSSVPNYLLNKFNFSFPFGKPVDEDDITAEYINGQLHVILNILSSAKGVKVNVKI